MAAKKQKSQAQHFTEEQIEKFRSDPNVRYVDDHTLRFKYEFRVLLYEVWEKEKRQGIKKVLVENGYDLKELGNCYIGSLCKSFSRKGRPTSAKNNHSLGEVNIYHTNPADNQYLISTGKFVRGRNGKGIAFSEDFKQELFAAYPKQSIEDGLRKAEIDPNMVGYYRIRSLQRLFDGKVTTARAANYSEEVIEKYRDHPYIRSVTAKQFRFSQPFYNEASFLIEIMSVDEILTLYEIAPGEIPISVRVNLKYRLSHWDRTDEQCKEVSSQLVRIQYHRYQKLTELVEERFRRIREVELPAMSFIEKKKLCYWIQGYPIDPMRIVSTSVLLHRIGISRSSYYSILRNDKYGMRQTMKEKQDEKEAEVIRSVMKYRGYRKGSRQIYMDMFDITGYQFSLKKIRRLMKKYDLQCGIRKKKQSRIEARKNLAERKKPNLLKRKFRLARPNTYILTDVTYIPYGNNQLAYGSAAIDAVTGRLYDLTISDVNDLNLVGSTLKELDGITFTPESIFHSDQGALYLVESFQNEVEELGFRQSMSRRGNCWDNAPQESFFGHFKDEFDYRSCTSLIELQTKAADYKEYFNTERRQWDRNRMTPLEYEAYLNSMSEEEFDAYLKKEEKKYASMKQRAADQARMRAKETESF